MLLFLREVELSAYPDQRVRKNVSRIKNVFQEGDNQEQLTAVVDLGRLVLP
jgi:hypothetical protein